MIAFTSVAETRFELRQSFEVKTPPPPPAKSCWHPAAASSDEVSISPQAQAKSKEVVEASAPEVQKPELNPYATAIIGYIEAQLLRDVADGASAEELQARLQAGVDGFLEGYGDALTQLRDQPGFTETVAGEVAQTRTQVLDAAKALAQELGLQAPVVAAEAAVEDKAAAPASAPESPPLAPVDALGAARERLVAGQGSRDIAILVDTLERTTLTYEHLGKAKKSNTMAQTYRSLETRSFALELKTLDGDTVNLTIRSEKNSSASLPGTNDFATSTQASDQLSFTVEGDLDEGELRAISELLADVNSLAQEFYQGDYTQALLEAQNMRFDESELASFDLGLKQTLIETYDQTVGEPLPGTAVEESSLRDYARQLLVDAGKTVHLGFKAELVVEYVEQLEILLDKKGLADFSRELFERNGFQRGDLARAPTV